MEVKVSTRYLRQAPRKLRLVADLTRGKTLTAALNLCQFSSKEAARHIKKLLAAGVAAAVNNFSLDKNNLYVKAIRVDQGPSLKRMRPRAHGRAARINHFSSHVWLTLAEINDSGVKSGKKQIMAAPLKLGEKPKSETNTKLSTSDTETVSANAVQEGKPEIIDPRRQSQSGDRTRNEGKIKGFGKRIFHRKSG